MERGERGRIYCEDGRDENEKKPVSMIKKQVQKDLKMIGHGRGYIQTMQAINGK